jgi:hypothetical protein
MASVRERSNPGKAAADDKPLFPSAPSMPPAKSTGSKSFAPGRFTLVASMCCAFVCLLDISLLLPHPAQALPDVKGDIPTITERGLPSPEVRKRYHQRLQALAATANKYHRNLTLASKELPVEPSREKSAVCRLAEAAVKEREAARVEARLFGSVGQHLALIVRDIYVYRSLDPFTPKKMLADRRQKMLGKAKDKNKQITDDEVCEAVVEASVRSNKAYDKAASAKAGISFAEETIWFYAIPSLCLIGVTYLVEVLRSRPGKPGTD